MGNKVYLVSREYRGDTEARENVANFTKREDAIKFLMNHGYEEIEEMIEEIEVDTYDANDVYTTYIFDFCLSCGTCMGCKEKMDEEIMYTDKLNVKHPVYGNKVFYTKEVNINNLNSFVYLYDYPLTIEVKTAETDETKQLDDCIKKVEKWRKENKEMIDKNTNWVDEKHRYRRLVF